MGYLPENISLKKFNTFGVDVKARYFAEFSSPDQIREFLLTEQSKIHPRLILGEGSNILFTKDFDGIVIRPLVKGIEVIEEAAGYVYLKAGAGDFYRYFSGDWC